MSGQRRGVGLSLKLIAGCTIVALAVCVAVATIGYYTYKDNINDMYERLAVTILKTAREYVDADDMRACVNSMVKSEKYLETQRRMDALKDDSGISYIYLLRVAENQKYIEYLLIAFSQEEYADPDFLSSMELLEPDYDNYGEMIPRFLQLQTKRDTITHIPNVAGDFEAMLSSHLPVYTSDGELLGILAVDISLGEIESVVYEYVQKVVIGTVIILLAFLSAYVFVYRRMILVPIHKLAESARAFVNSTDGQDKITNSFPEIKSGDEIEIMAGAFRDMADSIISYVGDLERVTREQARINTELSVATQIQDAMLPKGFLTDEPDPRFDIFATMKPAREVGGDFYDYFMVDATHLAVLIADVSGKSVPAALFMAIGKTVLKNCTLPGVSPAEVLSIANAQLSDHNENNLFITCFLMVLDLETGHAVCANAGHNLPLIRNGATYEWLKTRRALPLAAMEGVKYREQEVDFEDGGVLYLYTDGVTEAANKAQELFGDPRLQQAINKHAQDATLRGLLTDIHQDIDAFCDGAEQADDITMLALRFHKPQ